MDLRGLLLDYAGVLDEPGVDAVARTLRLAGVRTAVVSNADRLPEPGLADTVDAVVLSGVVGFAKPEAEIYRIAARRIGVRPEECVFVDDLRRNVEGAVAAGMVGINHADLEATAVELEALFGVDLGA
ncbi:HAD family hydrolase [Saccharopolyspora rhizosphaerae]|uniref:HAD family hydrolase n=1 Tax=Saccharopolyspora rhizosphaerae TaxID=2492662 RepID=A0A3R8PZL6_9PSEU|nr:HAD-IA family hydrolase [Saccharopolyspora rhizosphaerae]RRO13826.1 HAD family hydrolase [Saccharopolyspora rhizosphaerae]